MADEEYAAECDECGWRTRDESKIGETHDSAFCRDAGTYRELE